MNTPEYLNTVFAHCFIVFTGKVKLMISRSDATAQIFGTEAWKIGTEARKNQGTCEIAILWYHMCCAFVQQELLPISQHTVIDTVNYWPGKLLLKTHNQPFELYKPREMQDTILLPQDVCLVSLGFSLRKWRWTNRRKLLLEIGLFRILSSHICGINFLDSKSSERIEANATTWELHVLKNSPSPQKY